MNAAGTVSAGAAGSPLPPAGLPRLIQPGDPLTLADHIDRYGPVPFRDPAGRMGGPAGPG